MTRRAAFRAGLRMRMRMRTRMRGIVLLPVVLLLALIAMVAYMGNRETLLTRTAAGGNTDLDKARYAAEAGLQRAIVQMHTKGCGGTYPIFLLTPVKDTAFDGGTYNAYASPLSGSPATIYSTGTYGDASVTLTRSNVPMHQTGAYTMTLQPDAGGIDTVLVSGSSSSNGSAASLAATATTSFPLLRFDLGAIPAGAHVTSATLSAYASSGSGSGAVALQRVVRDWTETGATWTSADGTTAWSQPGGDVVAQAVSSATFTAAASWLSWDVTGLVDRWVKASLANQGVQLRAASTISGLALASSDSANATQRPTLSVTFLPPCGWTPPSTTLTLAPAADTDVDLYYPTSNFGTDPQLFLSKGIEAHPLLRFDLGAIAPGKTVETAKLRLYFEALGPGSTTSKALNLEVHAVTKAWTETAATWNQRVAGTSWSVAGGDYASSATATMSLANKSAPGVWLEFELKTLAQSWVDGVTVNNGALLLITTASTEQIVFTSAQGTANQPQLVVTYH